MKSFNKKRWINLSRKFKKFCSISTSLSSSCLQPVVFGSNVICYSISKIKSFSMALYLLWLFSHSYSFLKLSHFQTKILIYHSIAVLICNFNFNQNNSNKVRFICNSLEINFPKIMVRCFKCFSKNLYMSWKVICLHSFLRIKFSISSILENIV